MCVCVFEIREGKKKGRRMFYILNHVKSSCSRIRWRTGWWPFRLPWEWPEQNRPEPVRQHWHWPVCLETTWVPRSSANRLLPSTGPWFSSCPCLQEHTDTPTRASKERKKTCRDRWVRISPLSLCQWPSTHTAPLKICSQSASLIRKPIPNKRKIKGTKFPKDFTITRQSSQGKMLSNTRLTMHDH